MKILSGNMMEHLIAIVVSAMAFAVMAATPCPVVVIPDMPTEVEKFAAAELAGELGRCLGEVPKIVYKGVWKHELTKETSELLGFKAALSTDANRAAHDAMTARRDERGERDTEKAAGTTPEPNGATSVS